MCLWDLFLSFNFPYHHWFKTLLKNHIKPLNSIYSSILPSGWLLVTYSHCLNHSSMLINSMLIARPINNETLILPKISKASDSPLSEYQPKKTELIKKKKNLLTVAKHNWFHGVLIHSAHFFTVPSSPTADLHLKPVNSSS